MPHPNTIKALKSHFQRNRIGLGVSLLDALPIEFIEEPCIPETRKTGKIQAPDGTVHKREGFCWRQDDFTTLEESDLPWLMGLGICREHEVMVAYRIGDWGGWSLCMPERYEPSFTMRTRT